MKLKIHLILIFLVVFLSNKLVGQVITGELKPCPDATYTYVFSGPSFDNNFVWSVIDGTIVSQNTSTVVVKWNNNINGAGNWRLRVQYQTFGLGGTPGGSTYLDLYVKVNVASRYNISGETEIPGNFVGTKTYTATPTNSNFPASSFLWTTNTGVQLTTTSPSVTMDMSDKQIRWIGVSGKTSACSGWGEMSQLTINFSAIINGPSQICDEGTYTITNPGTITLVNATGIATLTALGNNQWKVTRTGTANGVVKLRSTSNGKTYEKEILIGAKINGYISGNPTVFPGKSYEYDLILNDNISNYQNLTFTGTSGMTIQILSPTKAKYTVLSNYAFAPGETERNTTIQVTANVPGCGNTSLELPIVVVNPKPTPIK